MKYFQICKMDLKSLNGFLPINKPEGISSTKLSQLLQADLNFVLKNYGINHGLVEVRCIKALEHFAAGILTFAFGYANYRRKKFVFSDYHHEIVIELGVERESHSICGPVLSRSETRHLHKNDIKNVLKSFGGTFTQSRCKLPANDIRHLQLSEKLASFQGIYDLTNFEETETSPLKKQKYPCSLQKREVTCRSIELIEYNEPFATLNIISTGALNLRQLSYDIGLRLETKASLVKMIRHKEGPICLSDLRVLQLHETQLEHYLNKLEVMRKDYNDYIGLFDDRC